MVTFIIAEDRRRDWKMLCKYRFERMRRKLQGVELVGSWELPRLHSLCRNLDTRCSHVFCQIDLSPAASHHKSNGTEHKVFSPVISQRASKKKKKDLRTTFCSICSNSAFWKRCLFYDTRPMRWKLLWLHCANIFSLHIKINWQLWR